MQKVSFFTLATLFFTFTFSWVGCLDYVPEEDDATPYIVNFTFSKPNGTVLPKKQPVPIEIRFDRTPSGYVHNIKIEVLNDKNEVVEKIFEQNVHAFKSYTYSDSVAFTPLSIGVFKIKASTTDDRGKQENKSEKVINIE
ncbi:MAG: hypothetical protein JNL70_19670 [Saprospiraceae bacterium]|nr:hypothetical protein [Saprospiraceae bacterium]